MNTNLSAFISWSEASLHMREGSGRSLLFIGDVGLKYRQESSFAERIWRKSCSIFGVGQYSLRKIVAVVEETLQSSVFTIADSRKLKKAINVLNEKIKSYERKDTFGLFPLFRKKIGKTLSFPAKIKTISSKVPPNNKKKGVVAPTTSPKKKIRKKHSIPVKMGSGSASKDTPKSKITSVFESKATQKVTSVTKDRIISPQRRGISNEGNTCFAAATIQALQALNPQISCEGLRTFCDELKSTDESKSQTGIKKLLSSLNNKSWVYALGKEYDPVSFYEDGVLPHVKNKHRWKEKGLLVETPAILNQKISVLPEDASTQKIVSGMYLKKPLELDSAAPDFFALCIDGRTSSKGGEEKYNQAPVSLDYTVNLAMQGDKKESYRLASIVMYDSHHYYSLEPVYENSLIPVSWNKYNDSLVSKVSHTERLEKTLRTNGYLFFYKKE